MDLHAYSGKTCDICGERLDLEVQTRDMQLKSNPIDRDTPLSEVFDHRVNRIRFSIHAFALGLVIEKKRVRIGLMRPAERLLDVCGALSCKSNSRLVVPE